MSRDYVLSICNALIDILVEVDHDELDALKIEKGVMHLVDLERQQRMLEHFARKEKTFELGGSAMNATRGMAALGLKTMFFGTVGDDDFGRRILDRMKELGIDSRVKVTQEPTGSCAILITPDGERTMNTHLGASCHYHEAIIPHKDIENAKILHFTAYQWSTDHQRYAIKQAILTAKKYGTLVSFDVADPLMCRAFRDDFVRVIEEDADIVFANAAEAHDLYQCAPEEAAQKIADTGAIAVTKLGARGALIKQGKDSYRIAAVKTEVVDTTAAGDMFAAGFLYGYMRDRPLLECGHMGALLASDVISRVGAVLSAKVLKQVKDL